MMCVRVRFTDKTELCWTLQTAHVLRESDLSDWKTGDCKQLQAYAGRPIVESSKWFYRGEKRDEKTRRQKRGH
jgi:hypothetical protein